MNATRICSLTDCERAHYGKGFCRKHWERQARTGDPNGLKIARDMTIGERLSFWSERQGACLVWTGSLTRSGYGQAYAGDYQYASAHRMAYEHAHGPIAAGLIVRHKCDNRACIEPEHLELGSHQDNMSDMVERQRSLSGERNPAHKLTPEDVAALRGRRTAGESIADLSVAFGISKSQTNRIVRGESWREAS